MSKVTKLFVGLIVALSLIGGSMSASTMHACEPTTGSCPCPTC